MQDELTPFDKRDNPSFGITAELRSVLMNRGYFLRAEDPSIEL
jgi:hypothetical protein